MRYIEYRVWCEFEVDGSQYAEMAGPESWFLLTQTGHLMSHGPTSFDPNAEQKYSKLVVEFYTGLKDKNGKVWHGDILGSPSYSAILLVDQITEGPKCGHWIAKQTDGGIQDLYEALTLDGFEVIGTIHENPELWEQSQCATLTE